MDMNPRARWTLRIQNLWFYVLFALVIGLLAWLSTRYVYEADWTAGARNTVSQATRELLQAVDGPVVVTAYVSDDALLHRRIETRMGRLRRYKRDISLRFVNPDLAPDEAREAGVQRAGQLVFEAHGRRVTVDDLAERSLAQALQRLVRREDRWVVFLEGHAERDLGDETNPGYSDLAAALRRSGISVQGLNLIRSPAVPDNTAVLVIAAPQSQLLPGEVRAVLDYLERGGKLLWLHDPGDPGSLGPLATRLGIRFIDGVLVDANPRLRVLLGIKHPAVIPVVEYPDTVLTHRIKSQTLFPFAQGIDAGTDPAWRREPFLLTLPRAWSETGALTGKEISFSSSAGDIPGPLPLGLILAREHDGHGQRVVVVGDSDFMANGYLGNGANLELGLNIFNWLSEDEALLSIVPHSAPDIRLELEDPELVAIAAFFVVFLPLGLLLTGLAIRLRRRRR